MHFPAETGTSVAELTRQAVDLLLEARRGETRAVLVERAIGIAGGFASGLTDVSADHDRYIAEAFNK